MEALRDTGWRLGRRRGLDGFRGLAIMLVVAAHATVPGFADGGVTGVTLFFVLSGFLITSLLVEERRESGRIDLRAFYRRRALRLLPALAVFLAAMVGAALCAHALGRGSESVTAVARDVLAALFFSANWFRVAGTLLGRMSHTWSLAIEEQFYLVWPAALIGLSLLARRSGIRAALIGAAAASIALRFALYTGPAAYDRVYFGTDTRADALLLGCLLALVLEERMLRVPALATAAALGAILAASAYDSTRFDVTWSPTIASFASVVIVASLATSGPATALFSWAPLVQAGRISYGLYLWHIPIYGELSSPLARYPLPVRAIVPFVLALAVSIASYRYVERPFLRRKRAGSRRGEPGAHEAARVPKARAQEDLQPLQ